MSPTKHKQKVSTDEFSVVYVGGQPEGNPLFYVNNIELRATAFDFQVKLNRLVDVDEASKMVKVVNYGTLAMSPQHAQSVVEMLTTALENYRRRYGEFVKRDEEKG
jgi:hypothetical protein